MIHRATLVELEMRCLEGLTRQELVQAHRGLEDCLILDKN